MTATTTLTLADGVKIIVPDSLDLITSYVLQEQEDWFEDEIKFLRRLLQPGQTVIDVGANYGVYALSMAQTVGPQGHVWAFEPASMTARLLAEGIAINGFTHVTVDQRALSSSSGTAQLSLNVNSELNALVRDLPSTHSSETVHLSTLDECMQHYDWQDIAFVKIDAEGEEGNILQGGKRFFAKHSPLIQYEVKAGTKLHMELVEQFSALGYDSYRLVPGLDLLIPFDAESTPDGFLLNLFCCKQSRAERLAADDYLLGSTAHVPSTSTERLTKIWKKFTNRGAYDWRHSIVKLPYGAQLARHWEQVVAAGGVTAEVDEALYSYSRSRDSSLTSNERFAALETSFNLLKEKCEREPKGLRLASLARVARDYGARSLAVYALGRLCDNILAHHQVDLSEPFLAPSERFDSIVPGKSIGDWVLAAALEEFERLESFSSFYTRNAAQRRLEMIRTLGFGSAEMARRLRLVQTRFPGTIQ